MIILNSVNTSGQTKLYKLPFYYKIVGDIKDYIQQVHHFDHEYIPIAYLMCKDGIIKADRDIKLGLLRRAIANMNKMSPI